MGVGGKEEDTGSGCRNDEGRGTKNGDEGGHEGEGENGQGFLIELDTSGEGGTMVRRHDGEAST
jgi:hypothetical protein